MGTLAECPSCNAFHLGRQAPHSRKWFDDQNRLDWRIRKSPVEFRCGGHEPSRGQRQRHRVVPFGKPEMAAADEFVALCVGNYGDALGAVAIEVEGPRIGEIML
jgi:hypothetical protein